MTRNRRVRLQMLVMAALIVALPVLSVPRSAPAADACGKWSHQVRELERPMSVALVGQPLEECQGRFRLTNETRLGGWLGGYGLEVRLHDGQNVRARWNGVFNDQAEWIFLASFLRPELRTTPLALTDPATVTLTGQVTGVSIAHDVALFMVKAIIELVTRLVSIPIPACLISEEFFYRVAISGGAVWSDASQLVRQFKYAELRAEIQARLPEFGEIVIETLKDVAMDCGIEATSELVVQLVSGMTAAIPGLGVGLAAAKLAAELIATIGKMTWDGMGDGVDQTVVAFSYYAQTAPPAPPTNQSALVDDDDGEFTPSLDDVSTAFYDAGLSMGIGMGLSFPFEADGGDPSEYERLIGGNGTMPTAGDGTFEGMRFGSGVVIVTFTSRSAATLVAERFANSGNWWVFQQGDAVVALPASVDEATARAFEAVLQTLG